MKKILLMPLFMVLCCAIKVNGQGFGAFATAVFVTNNGTLSALSVTGSGADQIGPSLFKGSLGTFQQNSGLLILNGGEVKSYKGNNANVCGATMYYRIHPTGYSGSFTHFTFLTKQVV